MNIAKLIRKNRAVRRFRQDHHLDMQTLKELVDLARLSASSSNQQPLRFLLSNEPAKNAAIFATLAWAAFLRPWIAPAEGERPAAYIVILADTRLNKSPQYDAGIACQSILLGASELGLGGCILGAIHREELRKALHIPNDCDIMLVIALGKPAETVALEDVKNGDTRYWRSADNIHHVPKRPLSELIVDFTP